LLLQLTVFRLPAAQYVFPDSLFLLSAIRLAVLYAIYYVTVVEPGLFGRAQDGDALERQIRVFRAGKKYEAKRSKD